MRAKWLRWSWILPAAELVVAAAVAGVPAARILRAEYKASLAPKPKVAANPKTAFYVIDMNGLQVERLISYGLYAPKRFEFVSFLNFPALFPSLIVDRFSKAWPEEWKPEWAFPLQMWGWRAISWPIFCLPFWWLAGRGMDAFFASLRDAKVRVIRWYEAWGLMLVGGFMLLVGTVLSLMTSPPDDMPVLRWLYVPGVMWFVFGLLPMLAWIRQRRARKRALSEAV